MLSCAKRSDGLPPEKRRLTYLVLSLGIGYLLT